MGERTEILRGLPLFAGLDQRGLEAVALLAREVDRPAGTVLMVEGEPADSFYVVLEGTVRVERDGRVVRSISSGGFLGEIALVERTPRTATATCVTDCRLLVVAAHEFERVMQTFPEIRSRVAAAVLRRPGRTQGEGSG